MRRGAAKIVAVSGAAIGALAFASVVKFAPLLVWNASPSAPIGLYRIERHDRLEVGDFALVRPDDGLGKFIAERAYLPENIPLLKRVAAVPGDEICRQSEAILINKIHVADALIFDSLDREMPAWSGCFTLQSDEIFLLNDPENSLDGRYFGATRADAVIGVARRLGEGAGAMRRWIGGRRRNARLKLWRYSSRKASLHVDSGGVTGEFSSAKWRHVVL